MPICYPRLVQTGLHQTDFPTLCWFEPDRLRMGGAVRHTQHTFRNTAFGIPGLCWLWRMGRPLIPAEADIPTHIWEWRNRCLLTPYTAWTPIEIPVYYPYESVDIWCRSRPGEKESYPYMHDKICDPVERYPCAGPHGGLAACGSDEPSGVTGPDRTASTPTEMPASSARTASTPVPSPTATDAPGTAAATAPPAVSGSAETDREALVAFYNATNGENWWYNDNWLSDAPLGEWYGVETNDDGRVIALNLNHNSLSREIPAELGGLSNLENLHLHTNSLSGEIPAELGGLSNLQSLWLGNNELSGCVPSSLEDRTHGFLSEKIIVMKS